MNLFVVLSFWGCAEKTSDSPSPDSGIVVGPPPEPEDTAAVDTAEDTGVEDTSIEDTGIEDTSSDTAIADSAEDTATEPSQEDTSVQAIQMPDFSLPDVNPYSPSLGATISVRDQIESISGWYFIKATWGYCRGQFALLNTMQNEISIEYPELPIKILSINQIGAESGVDSFNETHALPMVNDSATDEIWVQWESQWRDFYILNTQNELLEVYNLTQNNLNDPINYQELKQKLILAAQE